MKNIILIAPPGAGKGTQAKMLCDKYNMIHISVGDLLRAEVESKSELSESLEQRMKSGKLVEDEIIFKIMNKRLNDPELDGFILDGFPRNLNQAIELDKMTDRIDAVIYLEVSKKVLEERIVGRLVCPNCGNVYNVNVEKSKPLKENVCDKCESTLEKRSDDTLEVFEKRYETYMNETHPVLEFYKEKGNLYSIDSIDKDVTFEEIKKILDLS